MKLQKLKLDDLRQVNGGRVAAPYNDVSAYSNAPSTQIGIVEGDHAPETEENMFSATLNMIKGFQWKW